MLHTTKVPPAVLITIPRNEIARAEDEKNSLMYDRLIDNLPEQEKESLMDYIVSLSQ